MSDRAETAIVLFSGGQDSAVCLAWALKRFGRVETAGFDYGQRHRVELQCRLAFRDRLATAFPDFGARLGEDHLIDASALKALGATAMTHETEIETSQSGLPSTFVPGRNLLFLVLAGALAYRRGAGALVGGMCETDYCGYPDCRREAIDAQARALVLGMDRPLQVETPLMRLDKAQTWALAHELGGAALVELIVEETHTCYLGDRSMRHEWGYGCGACPACGLRARGWTQWREAAGARA